MSSSSSPRPPPPPKALPLPPIVNGLNPSEPIYETIPEVSEANSDGNNGEVYCLPVDHLGSGGNRMVRGRRQQQVRQQVQHQANR